jgi:hypothetical protein
VTLYSAPGCGTADLLLQTAVLVDSCTTRQSGGSSCRRVGKLAGCTRRFFLISCYSFVLSSLLSCFFSARLSPVHRHRDVRPWGVWELLGECVHWNHCVRSRRDSNLHLRVGGTVQGAHGHQQLLHSTLHGVDGHRAAGIHDAHRAAFTHSQTEPALSVTDRLWTHTSSFLTFL